MPADTEYPDLCAYRQGSAADLHAGGDLRASPDDREEVEAQRQKGYIRFSVQNGITVYEITDILRLKNMLEMGKIYRKIDGMAITVPVKKETGNVTDSLTD